MLVVYRQVWLVDTEFFAKKGHRVRGICVCAIELRSGVRVSRWVWDKDPGPCPWDADDPSVLVIAYSAVAECSFFLSVGWRIPVSLFDLWIAYRLVTNGRVVSSTLLSALRAEGIPHPVDDAEKRLCRQLCIDGGPFTAALILRLLAYCMSDVEPLGPLLAKVLPRVDLGQVLELSRYSAHIARVEFRGIPVDVPRLQLLSARWADVQALAAVRATREMRFQIFGAGAHPTAMSPSAAEEWLRRTRLLDCWPVTGKAGRPKLDKDTLRNLEGWHEDLVHLRQARAITVSRSPRHIRYGDDGRCRVGFQPYAIDTARNGPRAEWPMAYSGPIRGVVVPRDEHAIVILDVDQADPGTAAMLSGDDAMLADYLSGDFYLGFARNTHAIGPHDGPATVKLVRATYKTGSCAIMYGTGADNLSEVLGKPIDIAKSVIRRHRARYVRYWAWVRANLDRAAIDGFLRTSSGWTLYNPRPTAAMCFPVQAAGADLLHLASLRMEAAGIPIVWPNHDSVAAEVPARNVLDAALDMVRIWEGASLDLFGEKLRVSVQIVPPNARYFKDERDEAWWAAISRQLGVEP